MKTHKAPSLSPTGQQSGRTKAFSLLELLAVILTAFILAALVLPTLVGPDHKRPTQTTCKNNLKQLQLAWLSYAEDHHGKLAQNIARNIGGGHYATTPNQEGSQPGQPYASWVLGDASQPDPGYITNGLIYPYIGNLRAYKCPMDVKKNSTNGPSRRSYSMNAWMAGNPVWTSNCVNFTERAPINNSLSPSIALVFAEENPATINDGYWVQDPDNATTWIDSPAHHHLNAGGLSFADGHAQIRKWTDKYVLDNRPVQFPRDLTSGDLAWVQARCTVKAQ